PLPGFSILMTSAPRSARFWVHQGPARILERSITRTPLSALAIITAPAIATNEQSMSGAATKASSNFQRLGSKCSHGRGEWPDPLMRIGGAVAGKAGNGWISLSGRDLGVVYPRFPISGGDLSGVWVEHR